jgi:hypothetical protein
LDENKDGKNYVTQLQIIAFYSKQDGGREGVTLFCGKEKKSPFKFILRDPIHGRALGFGGVEELTESQVWTNYSQIRFRELLDATAKTIFQTTDQTFFAKRRLSDMANMEVATLEEGKTLSQVDTFPRNIQLFEKYTQEWEAHAQMTGAANDTIMGETPASGTPFKLQELITKEAHSLHEYRRGKFAKDIEEIYRDWIIPHIVSKINQGHEFLAELSLEEMQYVADNLITKKVNGLKIQKMATNEVLYEEEIETYKQQLRDEFMKDNKKFIKIAKDELKDAPVSISINISGKQKDLYLYTDKLVNVFRQIAAAPQLLDDPRMVKIFNQILESSGLDPVDFMSSRPQQMAQMAGQPATTTQPMQDLANNQQNYGQNPQ